MKKQYAFTLDFKAAPSINLPNIVSGDTGNEFAITVQDDGQSVDLSDERIRLVIANKDGVGSQDSDVENSDIDLTDAAQGVVRVAVHADMISNGLNIGCIEVYSGDEQEILSTTQSFTFTAKLSPSEKASAYPSLVLAEKTYQNIIKAVQEAMESMAFVTGSYIDAEGHLIFELNTGEIMDAGMVGNADDNVRYLQQTNSDSRKATARSNIGAASDNHAHGAIASDGKIAGRANGLLESDSTGTIGARRRIITGNTVPEDMQDGDIFLSRKAPGGDVIRIGEPDFSTDLFGAFSDPLTINDGERVTVVFRNHTDQEENWHNFILEMTVNGSLIRYYRPDNFSWGTESDSESGHNWDWTTFREDMQGALVEVSVARHATLLGSSSIRVEMHATTMDGKSFAQWYTTSFPSAVASLKMRLTVDHAYIDLFENLSRRDSVGLAFLNPINPNTAVLNKLFLRRTAGGLSRVKLSGEDSNLLEVYRAVSGKTAVPFVSLEVPYDQATDSELKWIIFRLLSLDGSGQALLSLIVDNYNGQIQLKNSSGAERNYMGVGRFACYDNNGNETARLNYDGTLTLLGTTLTAAKLAELLTFTPITLDGDGKVKAEQASAAIVTKSADCTLALSEAGRLLQVDAAADVTVTVPAHADVAFPVGTEIEVCQWGAGVVSIAGAAGVTIRSLDGCTDTAGQYATVALKKMSSNEWLLTGALA